MNLKTISRCREVAVSIAVDNKSKYKHSCLITRSDGRIVKAAKNSLVKTHPIQAQFARAVGLSDRIFLHAEIACLINCPSYGYHMFVARVNRDGDPLISKPCSICEEAIKQSDIKYIHFIDKHGIWKMEWVERKYL